MRMERLCLLVLLSVGMCINYQKLNQVTRKDYFPLLFLGQVFKRVVGNEFYYFLDDYSGYYQIEISLENQQKLFSPTPLVYLRFNECYLDFATHRNLSMVHVKYL